MCKISVVIPVYNTEKTLKKCVESLLNQTFKDFEVLLINDGSPDSSENICLHFAEKDCRVRYIKKENGGLSSVRNLGIEKAKGKYIGFIDSDDYVESNMLEFMYEKAEKENCDIVLCGYFIEKRKTKINNCPEMSLNESNYNDYLVELKSKNLIDSAWNKLYRLDFLRKSGVLMPYGELYEDTAFNLELLMFKPKINVYSECFYHYVQNMGSITHKYNESKMETMKKRARLLKKVSCGIDEYCDFYYIKSVLSSVIDMFLSLPKASIKEEIKKLTTETEFLNAAKNAKFKGLSSLVIIRIAKSKNMWLIYNFCRLCFKLKYK